MPKPKVFDYTKKLPFRDASLFIIICEGSKREPDYFRFFDGLSSRIKVITIPNESGKGSPVHLMENAKKAEETFLDAKHTADQIWLVIDTDRWQEKIHELRSACKQNSRWNLVQSNPCFEVWLYYHVKTDTPELNDIEACKSWKNLMATIIPGGFNSNIHPIKIEKATKNAKTVYKGDGYTPLPAHTQVWMLAEAFIPFLKRELDGIKHRIQNRLKN
jgi:L-rhamnose mutarotase